MSKLIKDTTEGEEGYFLRCKCYSEFINVFIFDDSINEPEGFVYLDLYRNYHSSMCNSWWNRIKVAIQVLWSGIVSGNDFVMDGEEAIELGEKMAELGRKVSRKNNV